MVEFATKYWLEVVFTSILAVIGWGSRRITKSIKQEIMVSLKKEITAVIEKEVGDQKILKLAMQAMLRDRLIQAYNYYIKIGCMAIHERDNLLNMYNQYHSLGANGVIDGLMDELFDLPHS